MAVSLFPFMPFSFSVNHILAPAETDGRNGESTLPPPLPSKGNNLAETKQACVLLGHTATLEKLAPALGVQFRLQNAGEKVN